MQRSMHIRIRQCPHAFRECRHVPMHRDVDVRACSDFFKCLMAPVSGNSPPFSLSLLAAYSASMASRLSHINRNMNSCDSRFLQFWQFLDAEHSPLH